MTTRNCLAVLGEVPQGPISLLVMNWLLHESLYPSVIHERMKYSANYNTTLMANVQLTSNVDSGPSSRIRDVTTVDDLAFCVTTHLDETGVTISSEGLTSTINGDIANSGVLAFVTVVPDCYFLAVSGTGNKST